MDGSPSPGGKGTWYSGDRAGSPQFAPGKPPVHNSVWNGERAGGDGTAGGVSGTALYQRTSACTADPGACNRSGTGRCAEWYPWDRAESVFLSRKSVRYAELGPGRYDDVWDPACGRGSMGKDTGIEKSGIA